NIISEGVKELLKGMKFDINVSIRCCGLKEIIKEKPDLVIADFNTLSHKFHDIPLEHDMKILLLESECLPMIENKFFLDFISKGLVGILSPDTNLSQLLKAIKSVISGELWFDRNKYRDIITITNDVSAKKSTLLSRRELEIVKMICRGYSNREIMKDLNISEQSVKSHLNRIYKKTGVTDRLQLAVIAIKTNQFKLHQILQKKECTD
ncbi:MAG: response regulator transcription factor, partial [Candidatus Scalinduaceae bacterium]